MSLIIRPSHLEEEVTLTLTVQNPPELESVNLLELEIRDLRLTVLIERLEIEVQ